MSSGSATCRASAVGHYTDPRAATGCTVVLCDSGAVGGVDVRGSAPGTRETDLLRPGSLVPQVDAVLLTGGSAFGLSAASGVVRYLEERGRGYRAGPFIVPIVSAAVLFDLGVGDSSVRPGPEEGYRACEAAASGDVAQGSVGAGTGATVGKALGVGRRVKGGVGTAGIDLGDGVIVGAIVAVNAVGGVHDPDTGELVAGAMSDDGGMVDVLDAMVSLRRGAAVREVRREHDHRRRRHERPARPRAGQQAGRGRPRRHGPGGPSRAYDPRRRHDVRARHRDV